MYENQTEEVILKRMLNNVPPDTDKREGSVIYDSTMPAAIEFMLVYAMCDYFLKNTFGDTAERLFLVERAKERGLAPTFPHADICAATLEVVLVGGDALAPSGLAVGQNKPAGPFVCIHNGVHRRIETGCGVGRNNDFSHGSLPKWLGVVV